MMAGLLYQRSFPGLLAGTDLNDALGAPEASGLLDPFEVAALRQRRTARPPGGRQEGAFTKVLESYVPHVLGTLLSLPRRSFEAAEHYSKTGEYDPVFLEAAMLPVAGRMAVAQRGTAGPMVRKPSPLRMEEPTPAAASGAPFPQYAEVYPPVGPPKWMFDKQKGKLYPAKKLTPEAEAFKAKRDEIQRQMDAEGYQPYFDAEQRQHVNPVHYPPNINTLDIVPRKQETIAKHMEAIGSPEARKRLNDAYDRGSAMPRSRDWAGLKQVEDEFVKELGEVEGRKAFADRFVTPLAITSAGANPEANLLMSQYVSYMRTHNLPVPEASHQYPYPVGGQYGANNMAMAQKKTTFADLGASTPKRHDYGQELMGNPNVGAIDAQITSAMTPGLQAPPAGTHGLYGRVLAEEAAKRGVRVRDFKDAAWVGLGRHRPGIGHNSKNMSLIEEINDSIERTHRLTGMPVKEIVRRGLVRREIPMYGVGAGLFAPTALSQGDGED